MCGSGSQTKTSTQDYNADPAIRRPAHMALNQAMQLAQQGYHVPTQQYAGFTPDQRSAFQSIRQDYDIAQPYYQKAGAYTDLSASAINPDEISNYFNPYSQYALAGLNEDIGVQNRDLSGRLNQATGGVGADRIAVGMAEKSRTDQLARGQLMAGFYDKSLGAAQMDRARQAAAGQTFGQLGSGAQGAALQGDQALYGSGTAQQGLKQQRMNAQFAAAMANLEAPWKANQYLTSTVGGLAPALGGTTKTTETLPPTSPWGSIAGLGMTGLGLMSGNPMMAMGGIGGMFGGGSGGGAGFGTTPAGWTGNTGYPGWLQPTAAYGGRINGFADGGAVNPFDIGMGFADGGAPDIFDWTAPRSADPFDWNVPPDHGQPNPFDFGSTAPQSPVPSWATVPPSFAPGPTGKIPDRAPVNTGPPVGAPIVPSDEPPPLPPGSSGMMPDPFTTPRTRPPALPADAPALPPNASPASLPGAAPPAAGPLPAMPSMADFMPRTPKTGTLSDRLLEAGLTTLAHADDRDARGFPVGPLSAIGKGGLAALEGKRKDYSQDQKQIAIEQNAKKLMESAQHWRTTAAESARTHDLLADYRDTKLSIDQQKALAGNWVRSNETRPDPETGLPVKGMVKYNTKTNEEQFFPGQSTEGKGGGASTGQERMVADLKKESPGITTREALAILKRPGTSDPDIRWKETLALTAAKADPSYLTDPDGTLAKFRKGYLGDKYAPLPAIGD